MNNILTRKKVLVALLVAGALITATMTFAGSGKSKGSTKLTFKTYEDQRNGGNRYDKALGKVQLRYVCSAPKQKAMTGVQATNRNGTLGLRNLKLTKAKKATCKVKVEAPTGYVVAGKTNKKFTIKRGQKKTVKIAFRAVPGKPDRNTVTQPATGEAPVTSPGSNQEARPPQNPPDNPSPLKEYRGQAYTLQYPYTWTHFKDFDEELQEEFEYLSSSPDKNEGEWLEVESDTTSISPKAFYDEHYRDDSKILEERALTINGHPAYFVREEYDGAVDQYFFISNGRTMATLIFQEAILDPPPPWFSDYKPEVERIANSIKFQ